MKSSSLLKLSTLGLSSEQMAKVLEVLAEELAPLEERRERDRLRKRDGKSKDVPPNVLGNSAENPRIAPAVVIYPPSNSEDKQGITPLNPPSTQNPPLQLVPRETPPEYPEGFDAFWEAYPARAGGRDKPGAVKAYRAAMKRSRPDQIAAGARAYRDYCEAAGKIKTEFVLQARTWLNRNGWTEDYEHSGNRPRFRSNLLDIAAE